MKRDEPSPRERAVADTLAQYVFHHHFATGGGDNADDFLTELAKRRAPQVRNCFATYVRTTPLGRPLMVRRREHVPCEGPVPDVRSADVVECRDAGGRWWRKVAAGPARYDDANSFGWRTYLTVPVLADDGSSMNWPAEDVRVIEKEPADGAR